MNHLDIIANILRRDVIEMTTAAGSGHPTTCMSCAEIMSVLFFSEMKYNKKNANDIRNDEFILSKGHAAPILYSALYRAGMVRGNLKSLRKFGSKFEGHPIPNKIDWVKVASGSLGQGLSVGVGMALSLKKQGIGNRVYVLLGDSEMAEGSNFEALQLGGLLELENLVGIVDVNRLGQRGETMLGHNMKSWKKRYKGFGWDVVKIDGHNVKQVKRAIGRKGKRPKLILAKTYKGKGFSFVENKNDWHGKALEKEQAVFALKLLGEHKMPKFHIGRNKGNKRNIKKGKFFYNLYNDTDKLATRKAYGKIISKITRIDSDVMVLDSEVSNSTYAKEVKELTPSQFIECYIAEQNMVGMALGMSKKGHNVFASTFSAFLTRAHDQLRMAAFSSPSFTLVGSHCGVSIGQDGSSQMGLGDIAMFRNLPKSIIFYPSDAVSCEKLVGLAYGLKGLKYIRTTRGDTPVVYSNKEKFKVGEFKVLRDSGKDKCVLVGAGVTLHECLAASEKLGNVAVVDLFCIKPFNSKGFIDFVKKHGKKVVVVEDHFMEGGIGEMVKGVLSGSGIKVKHLGIAKIPHSGKGEVLMKKYGIDSEGIVKAVRGWW